MGPIPIRGSSASTSARALTRCIYLYLCSAREDCSCIGRHASKQARLYRCSGGVHVCECVWGDICVLREGGGGGWIKFGGERREREGTSIVCDSA